MIPLGTVILSVLLIAASAVAEPTTLPALQQRLDAKEYQTEFDAAVKKIDRFRLNQADPGFAPADPNSPIDPDAPWYPELAYVNSKEADPRWDSAMLVACTRCDDQPKLAEAALRQAQQAGYHGWLLPALASRIAWVDWRFTDATAFGRTAIEQAPQDRQPLIARWTYAAAKACFQYDLAEHLAETFPLCDDDEKAVLKSVLRSTQRRPTTNQTPLESLAKRTVQDRTAELHFVHIKGSYDPAEQSKALRNTGKIHVHAPLDHFMLFALGPGGADVDASVHFRFTKDFDDKITSRAVSVGLMEPRQGERMQCNVEFYPKGLINIRSFGPVVGPTEVPKPDWDGAGGTVRLVAVGPNVQIFVDGRQVFYGPLQDEKPDRSLVLLLRASGMQCVFDQISWKDAPPPATQPASQPAGH